MKCKPLIILTIIATLLLVPSVKATLVIQADQPIAIDSDTDLTFTNDYTTTEDYMSYGQGNVTFGGDWWINSTVDVTVITVFEANWFTYSVSGVGTQMFSNTTAPSKVWIDGFLSTKGTGWTESSGTVTVSSATSDVMVLWETVETPVVEEDEGHGGSTALTVTFLLRSGTEPARNATVKIANKFNDRTVATQTSGSDGKVGFNLGTGQYSYVATYKGKAVSGDFMLIEDKVIEVNFIFPVGGWSLGELNPTMLIIALIGIIAIIMIAKKAGGRR